jgi:hypothetical protein
MLKDVKKEEQEKKTTKKKKQKNNENDLLRPSATSPKPRRAF